MRSFPASHRLILVATLLLFAAACPVPQSQAAALPQETKPFELKLRSQQIYRIPLDKPRTIETVTGQRREVTEAYLVMLGIDKPPFYGPAMNILIGEYEVPEYGGWKNGIYFRIYDPELLRDLGGRDILYRVGRGTAHSFGVALKVPQLEEVPTGQERELLRSAR